VGRCAPWGSQSWLRTRFPAGATGCKPVAGRIFKFSPTLGEPTGAVKKYLDWVHSEEGQKIVLQSGYVPLPK